MSADHLVLLTKFAANAEKYPRAALFCLKSAAEWRIPDSRVRICHRHRLPERETVDLWYNAERGKAYYHGLMKCGAGWICPVCAIRLAEIRKEQLRTALDNSRETLVPLMITYTVQHHRGQNLKRLMSGMNEAYRALKSGRPWQEIKREFKVVGEIRALEITYGDNGFHPHYHVIMWLDILILQEYRADDTVHLAELRDYLEVRLTPLWIAALEKHGLTALAGPALNVKSGWDTLDDYVTKSGRILPSTETGWTLAEELTYSARKKSRDEGLTMWDILTKFAVLRDPYWGDLFAEYVGATKGKSALQWTRGLKTLLGVETDEDAELQKQEHDDTDILLAEVSIDQWRDVIATGAEGRLLDAANTGDPAEIARLLREVSERAKRDRLAIPD